MTTKKATKTITLSKGMQDDADQFMLEPPNTSLVLNGDFDKPGVITKRKGLENITVAPTTTGDPEALLTSGDKLLAVGTGLVQEYDGTSWGTARNFSSVGYQELANVKTSGHVVKEQVVTEGNYTYVAWLEQELDSVGAASAGLDINWRLKYQIFDNEGSSLSTAIEIGYNVANDFALVSNAGTVYMLLMPVSTTIPVWKATAGNQLAFDANLTLPGGLNPYTLYANYSARTDTSMNYPPGDEWSIPDSIIGDDVDYFTVAVGGTDFYIMHTDTALTTHITMYTFSGYTQLYTTSFATHLGLDLQILDDNVVYLMYNAGTLQIVAGEIERQSNPFVQNWGYNVDGIAAEDGIIGATVAYDGTDYMYAISFDDRSTLQADNDFFGYFPLVTAFASSVKKFLGGDNREQTCTTRLYRGNTSAITSTSDAILGYRISSQGGTISGKTVVALSEAVHGAMGLRNCHVNYWKSNPIVNFDGSNISVETLLSPNESYPIPHTTTTAYLHLTPILSNGFTLSKVLVSPTSVHEPERGLAGKARTEIAMRTAKFGDVRTKLVKLQTIVPATISTGQETIIAAGIPYTYDGNNLMEQSPLGVPKIQKVDVDGYIGFSVLSPQIYLIDDGGGNTDYRTSRTRCSTNLEDIVELVENIYEGASTGVDNLGYSIVGIQAVVTRTDNKGNVYRSAPSPTMYFIGNVDSSDVSGGQEYRIHHTAKMIRPQVFVPISSDETAYTVEIYGNVVKTQDTAFDLPFRLLGKQSVNHDNGFTEVQCQLATSISGAIGITYTTDLSLYPMDIPLEANIIYTDTDELPGDTIGPIRDLAVFQSRIAYVPNTISPTIKISHAARQDIGSAVPSAFTVSFPEEDSIIAMEGMDDKLIVFFPSATYAVFGSGPDITGDGPDWSIQKLPSDIGVLDPRSVVSIPDGILFRGKKGFYLLDRGLNLTHKGNVDDIIKGTTVTAAYQDSEKGNVVFSLSLTGTANESDGPNYSAPDIESRPPVPYYGNEYSAGYAVVYDYLGDNWSVYTSHDFESMITYNGKFTGIKSDWKVYQPREGYADDNFVGQDNLLRITSPWIKFGNMQDFGALNKLTFIGRYYSELYDDGSGNKDAGDLSIDIMHDYEYEPSGNHKTNYVFTTQELFVSNDGGSTKAPQRLQVDCRPGRRKCQAVKLDIKETASTGSYRTGRGFEISSIDMHLRLKGGSSRLPKGRKG